MGRGDEVRKAWEETQIDNEQRSLHDVIVQEGYLYASYWDDGAVVLDVGCGSFPNPAATVSCDMSLDEDRQQALMQEFARFEQRDLLFQADDFLVECRDALLVRGPLGGGVEPAADVVRARAHSSPPEPSGASRRKIWASRAVKSADT